VWSLEARPRVKAAPAPGPRPSQPRSPLACAISATRSPAFAVGGVGPAFPTSCRCGRRRTALRLPRQVRQAACDRRARPYAGAHRATLARSAGLPAVPISRRRGPAPQRGFGGCKRLSADGSPARTSRRRTSAPGREQWPPPWRCARRAGSRQKPKHNRRRRGRLKRRPSSWATLPPSAAPATYIPPWSRPILRAGCHGRSAIGCSGRRTALSRMRRRCSAFCGMTARGVAGSLRDGATGESSRRPSGQAEGKTRERRVRASGHAGAMVNRALDQAHQATPMPASVEIRSWRRRRGIGRSELVSRE